MKTETQKLISNLKKEIEEINKKETITQTDLSNYNFKKAQLQFAEKLIEAIKKDVEDLKIKYKGQMAVKPAFNKLIKILNGAMEK